MATAAMFEPGDENRTNDDDDEGIGFPQSLFLLWIPHKERAVRKIDARVMWKVRKARNAHLEIVDRAFQRLLARLRNVCFAEEFHFLYLSRAGLLFFRYKTSQQTTPVLV